MRYLLAIAAALTVHGASAQLGVRYDPTVQPTTGMQYFRPIGSNLFVGDCIPFSLNGKYYYYWLLDSAHHKSLNGLGGHQWALSTSDDLVHWKQYPIVLGIDEEWEKSICTGSVVYYKGKYYAFYATRLLIDGKTNEQLSYAISDDGVHFAKQKPNPFYTSAPGYSKRNFRDPKVFVDADGVFHLFVASNQEHPKVGMYSGCLVHLSSSDLAHWTVHDPILTGQGSTPECPDYFLWKGWYYLVYSDNSNTYYLKSRKPYGPWEEPRYQALNEDWANVVKTAAFKDDRRIAAAWVPSRSEASDRGHEIFGGNSLFRELTQEADGTLDTRFPPEMVPPAGDPVAGPTSYTLSDFSGVASARIMNVPANARITLEVVPDGPNEELGLVVKSDSAGNDGYRLNISAPNETVSLGDTRIEGVQGLQKPFTIDLVMKDGILDADIDHRRTIVNRTYDLHGDVLWLYAKHGKALFKNITIRPLL